jgi:hypothetical protein
LRDWLCPCGDGKQNKSNRCEPKSNTPVHTKIVQD